MRAEEISLRSFAGSGISTFELGVPLRDAANVLEYRYVCLNVEESVSSHALDIDVALRSKENL